ncbi:MAG: phage portal protein [Candidatus Fimivivens sp.]
MQGDIKNRIAPPLKLSVSAETEITPKVIGYLLRENIANMARYRSLGNYYSNETAIQRRLLDSDKPNNRISHAYAKYITKIATAFFMGRGLRIEAADPAYKAALEDAMDTTMADSRRFESAKEMSKCGIAYEWLFFDEDGKLRSQTYRADEMVPVFSQTPDNYLSYVLRPYRISRIDIRRTEEFVEVIGPRDISIYHKEAGRYWTLVETFTHGFSDVPVIIRQNNAEMTGDYEDIIPQIDAYDKSQSDTQNDLDYFSDAYLVMEGVDDIEAVDDNGDELPPGESAKIMRRNRLLYLPTGCSAQFITKDSNDTGAENHKTRLRNDIFFLSQVPNLTDESFAGNLSGVAIKYKLFGLEELVIEKESYFTSSEMKKIRLITDYLNTLYSKAWDWKTITLKFDRSAVANTSEIASIMNSLRDILSEKTLIGMWPDIEDAAAEVAQKHKEDAIRENLDYNDGDDG